MILSKRMGLFQNAINYLIFCFSKKSKDFYITFTFIEGIICEKNEFNLNKAEIQFHKNAFVLFLQCPNPPGLPTNEKIQPFLIFNLCQIKNP